jgi:hypothetical protein
MTQIVYYVFVNGLHVLDVLSFLTIAQSALHFETDSIGRLHPSLWNTARCRNMVRGAVKLPRNRALSHARDEVVQKATPL